MSIARKVLTLLGRGHSVFGDADALSLKNRFLFALLDKAMPPSDIGECLHQDKTNVAHLASGLEKEGLVQREVIRADKRRIRYVLTDLGRQRIEGLLSDADARFDALLDSAASKQEAEQSIDDVIRLLSFL